MKCMDKINMFSIRYFIFLILKLFEASDIKSIKLRIIQPAFTCSKLTIETLEQGVKYVQS